MEMSASFPSFAEAVPGCARPNPGRARGVLLVCLNCTAPAPEPANLLPCLQTPPPAQETPPPKAEETAPKRRELSDDEARTLLKEIEKNLKAKEPRARMETLKQLTSVQSEVLVKPMAGLLKDKDLQIAIHAIHVLEVQPYDSARSALLSFLRNDRIGHDETLGREAVRALGKLGYGNAGYAQLRKLFDHTRPVIKREILLAFAANKDKRAFSLLVDTLEEPIPASVDAASNPPAAYWKEKYQLWQLLRIPAQRSLTEISGVTLKDAEAYREWAKSGDGKKLGFMYKRGD